MLVYVCTGRESTDHYYGIEDSYREGQLEIHFSSSNETIGKISKYLRNPTKSLSPNLQSLCSPRSELSSISRFWLFLEVPKSPVTSRDDNRRNPDTSSRGVRRALTACSIQRFYRSMDGERSASSPRRANFWRNISSFGLKRCFGIAHHNCDCSIGTQFMRTS